MRTALNVLGALLVLFGGVWFFQGINVLPGSFMTGQIRWAVYGGLRWWRALLCWWRRTGGASGRRFMPRAWEISTNRERDENCG